MKRFISFFLFLQLCFVATIFSQTQPSVREILNADGSVRLDREGGYDVEGYKMIIDKDGKPRFLSKTESALSDSGTWSSLGLGSVDNGTNGAVRALAVYNGELYIGGDFKDVRGALANCIARWNGADWSSVGTGSANGVGGSGSSTSVLAMAVFNGELYVGGRFTQAGGVSANGIARWNGISWNIVGTGQGNGVGGIDPFVYTMCVFNGELYVGGRFQSVNWTGSYSTSLSANRIARWNGSSWNTVGGGSTNGVSGGNDVNVLAVYNNVLYVGGQFSQAGGVSANNIAQWNGTSWNSVGSGSGNGVNGAVLALTVYNGELYVGGIFMYANWTGNSSTSLSANRIARWNGSNWNNLIDGTTNGVSGTVNTMFVYNGELYVGGLFNQAGNTYSRNLAKWNGTNWNNVGNGIGGYSDDVLYALVEFNGYLYIGGKFTLASASSGNKNPKNIAAWNGSDYYILKGNKSANGVWGPSTPTVKSLAIYNGELYVAGGFYFAGGDSAYGIARWNGNSWNIVGTGTSSANIINGSINAMIVYNNELYVGGSFTQAGGIDANNIARWNGTSWNSVGSGSTNGVSMYKSVYALGVYNGELYVGGDFTEAGGISVNYIARWDGTNWNPVGSGSTNGVYAGRVSALAVYNGELYVGGGFTYVNYTGNPATSVSANNIARWNGTNWNSVGTGSNNGVSGIVNVFTIYNGELYVGGEFTSAGGVSANKIARWNGTSWNSVGTGLNNGVTGAQSPEVFALAVYSRELYVGGNFTQAGGINVNRIARWNGTSWNSVGTGISGGSFSINSFTIYNDELYAGGSFLFAGGVEANNIARWTISGATGVEENEITPTNFILHQNYPNPFNPSTTISFTIPKSNYVTLKVYDVLGREVAELVNGDLQAGSHSINFDASRLSSGTYFYRLQAGNGVKMKKMMLIK